MFCLLEANCSVYDQTMGLAGICYTRPLCEGCRRRTEYEINLLRYDYVDLTQVIPEWSAPSRVKIARPKPASSPPLNLTVFTLREEIVHLVKTIEDAVRERKLERLPTRDGWALDQGARYLQVRVDDIARLPPVDAVWTHPEGVTEALAGPELICRLGVLHRRARRAVGLEVRTERMPGHCPYCSAPSLRRLEAELWCAACKSGVDVELYLSSVRMDP